MSDPCAARSEFFCSSEISAFIKGENVLGAFSFFFDKTNLVVMIAV